MSVLNNRILKALEKVTITSKDLSNRAMKLQNRTLENAVAELKLREDIKSCLARAQK